MKHYVHHNQNGFVTGSTTMYQDGENQISNYAAIIIEIIGLIGILGISTGRFDVVFNWLINLI